MGPIKTDEKTGIMYGEWAAEDPKAVLLLVHGLGADIEQWDFFGRFFADNSIASYAIELKGFGQTKGARGDIGSFDTYTNDIMSLYGVIAEEYPSKKVLLAGESMGALISFIMAGSGRDIFNGLICISPAFASILKFSFLTYADMLFSYLFRPKKYFLMPFDPTMCTRDEEYRASMSVGSVENRLVTARFLSEMFFAQRKACRIKRGVKIPALFLLAGEDKITDTKASEKIFRDIGSQDKDIILYPEMYHALSVELGREKVFEDILRWIYKRI